MGVSRIPLSPPELGPSDLDLLSSTLRGASGGALVEQVEAFEAEAAQASGRAHGVATTSGTAALHLALRELGVGDGDEVLVSTFTGAGAAHAVVHCGATPVFVDADPETWQVNPALVAAVLESRGEPVKAAVLVDAYGCCADHDVLVPLLHASGVAVVEDASQAMGAVHRDRPAGSFGDVAVASLGHTKLLTTTGGGLLLTDRADLAERCRHLADRARGPEAHDEHHEIGFSYRLSGALAALGRSQLATLRQRAANRRMVEARYREALAGIDGVAFMPQPRHGRSSGWLTCITVDPEVCGVDRDKVRRHLDDHEIESRPTWKPMHRQPVYDGAPAVVDGTAERLFERGLCLPSSGTMPGTDQDWVIEVLRDALVPG